ncbi:hypothetical protein HW555_014248 [Spodoptera exigua]|uniref:FLYWCH-type domain-containing protein n=1 Tax=Spodoptera exigua TaxID=7107 RepID=A0A835G325_SPOEX|nr:hypothetical protein HW555_014248 [Spodoptera exigua]
MAMEFYLRPSGRINLRLNNFTFYKHLKARSNAHRWSCTAYGSKWKCKAHLIITDRLEVLKANIFHSHPPSLKKEMKGPVPKLMKKEGKQDTQNNSNISIDENYSALTPFQNYLAAHSVFVNIFMTTRGKERLIFNDYTYYKQSRTKCGFRWGCTKNRWHKCKAYLHLSDDMTIVRSNMDHTHTPFSTPEHCNSLFIMISDYIHIHTQYITLVRGTRLLLLDGFSFFKSGFIRNGGSRYTCSASNNKSCRAFAHISSDDVLIKANLEHNHLPPQYKQLSNGRYLKL